MGGGEQLWFQKGDECQMGGWLVNFLPVGGPPVPRRKNPSVLMPLDKTT